MYDGHVEPGGPADVRELQDATLRKMSVSEMHNNVYLITCRSTGEQLLVDAADDADRVMELVHEGTGRLMGVLTTHYHWDHVRALAEVVERTGASTYAGAPDVAQIEVPTTHPLEHGDQVHVGDLTLDVIALRGHTPGSIALALRDSDGSTHLVTGDSLFPGGVGNTRIEGRTDQSFDSLIDDVEQRVFDIYEDAWFYPGHGDDSTLAVERPHLSEWRARGW